MRKKKFLEILNKKLLFLDDRSKKDILQKYDNMICKKMIKVKEKDVIKSLNLDFIVKKEMAIYKTKLFFKRIKNSFNKFFCVLKEKLKLFKTVRKKTSKAEKSVFHQKNKTNGVTSYSKNTYVFSKSNKIILFIVGIILYIVLFFLGIIFFINIVAFLDGIKLYSFILISFVLILIVCFSLRCIVDKLNIGVFNFKKYNRYYIILISLLGCSFGYLMFDIYRLEEVDDFSEYYTMSRETNMFDIDSDEVNVKFNHIYDNKYNIKYDDSLDNEIKIVANYYRNYYDLVIKKNRNDLYVSFHVNSRDVISTLIDGLKQKSIYNLNELKRYDITIYINEKDKNKINFI